jgi:hypothetical protein
MRKLRSAALLAAAALAASAAPARAQSRPAVDLGARLGVVVQTDRSSAPLAWDHASRSPVDRSRLMLDLRVGGTRAGDLYLKGAADWSRAEDAGGAATFRLEQGDYLWRHGDAGALALRAFYVERRYFTGALGIALVDDAHVSRVPTHGGLRADGDVARVRWSLVAVTLDDAFSAPRGMGHGRACYEGRHVQLAAAYLAQDTGADSLSGHAIVSAEAVGFYRGATAVASYAQSGFGASGLFFPSPRAVDGGGGLSGALPANAAAFGELRLGGIHWSDWHGFVAARYALAGPSYANDLAGSVPASAVTSARLFMGHARYAASATVELDRSVRWSATDAETERALVGARAFYRQGYEAFVRLSPGRRRVAAEDWRDDHFAHAGLRRVATRYGAGVFAMARSTERGGAGWRAATELRVKWGARGALYGRVVMNEEAASTDALYLRFELRPRDHLLATFAFGRAHVGDGPYPLEDDDILPDGPADNVYTITLRGDF